MSLETGRATVEAFQQAYPMSAPTAQNTASQSNQAYASSIIKRINDIESLVKANNALAIEEAKSKEIGLNICGSVMRNIMRVRHL